MKTPLLISFLCLVSGLAFGQAAEPIIVARGPHHRVIERTITETQPDGTTAERILRFTELATGLHFKNELGVRLTRISS